MGAEACIKAQEALDAKRSQKEWYRQTRGIDSEKGNSLHERILGRREPEDYRQDRTDAGSPAKGKGEANQKCSSHGASALDPMEALVAIEGANGHEAGQMQAKQDDDYSSDLRQS